MFNAFEVIGPIDIIDFSFILSIPTKVIIFSTVLGLVNTTVSQFSKEIKLGFSPITVSYTGISSTSAPMFRSSFTI